MENTLQEEQEEMWREDWREGTSAGVKRRHTSGGERSQVATTRKRSGGVWEKSFDEMEEKMEVEGEKRIKQEEKKVEAKEGDDDSGWQVQTKRKKRKKNNKESHEEGKQDNKDDKKKDINFGILRARLRRKRKEEKNEEKRITLMMVEEERRLADQVGVGVVEEEGGSSRGEVVEEVTMMPPVHELIHFNRSSSRSQSQEDDEGQNASVRTNWMLQSTKVRLSQEVIKKPQGSNKGTDCDKGQSPSQGHGCLDTDSLDYADAVEVRIRNTDLFLLQNSYSDG